MFIRAHQKLMQGEMQLLLSELIRCASRSSFIYTRAFGDGPRNFEPWSSDVRRHPLQTTTPHQREDVSALDRFSVHCYPTRRVFMDTGLELLTKPATIRYLYHLATTATPKCERDFIGRTIEWRLLPPIFVTVIDSIQALAECSRDSILPIVPEPN
ncbi:hypothetical protein TNCV_2237401 [Trichonephila clavipes]|nr:hypothetical protein TNCV_2237401 [Trichonephila clavipes]